MLSMDSPRPQGKNPGTSYFVCYHTLQIFSSHWKEKKKKPTETKITKTRPTLGFERILGVCPEAAAMKRTVTWDAGGKLGF